MPRPASFNFSFQREAEKRPDPDDHGNLADAGERKGRGYGANYVCTHQKLKCEQNAPAEVCSKLLVAGAPAKVATTIPDKPDGRENDAKQNDRHACDLKKLRQLLYVRVDLLLSSLIADRSLRYRNARGGGVDVCFDSTSTFGAGLT